MFCILIVFYAFNSFGFQVGYQYIAEFDFNSDTSFYLLMTGVGGAFVAAAGTTIVSRLAGGSFSVIYLIPAAALGFSATTLLAPIGFIVNAGIPSIFKILLMGYIYTMILMGSLAFIRGGEP
jgi:hypothetical protein